MAAQKGRAFLFKFDSDGGGTNVLIAGERNTSFTINNEPVNITTKDDETSDGALHRVLLAQAGESSMQITVDGVYGDETTFAVLREAAIDNTHLSCRIEVAGSTLDGYIEASFMVANFGMSGAQNNEISYTFTLESAGEYDYTLNA